MNNLVIMHDKQAVTSSLQVAETFGKQHKHILGTIRELMEGMPKNGHTPEMFAEGTYTNEQNGQQYPMYYMTRDGFTLLAMGFTGRQAMLFKLQYIEAFNSMEASLKQGQIDMTGLSPSAQAAVAAAQALADQERRLSQVSTKVDAISDIVATSTMDWRNATRDLIHRIARARQNDYQLTQKDIYHDVDTRGGVALSIRLTNLRNRLAGEGASKTKQRSTNKVDVIANDKKLIEIYMAVVKDHAIKYRVWDNEY